MKWNLLITTLLAKLTVFAQPNFNGGSNDGSAGTWLERSYGYNMYNQWSYGDGATANKLPAPTAFNMFNGGVADGSAWHNGHSPLAINMYNGGKQDGYATSALPGASFNLYKGGANDGQSASALTPAMAFNMYAGGNSDGFAWNNGYSPLQVNLFNGGTNDGFGTGSLLPATAFNVFAGGSNDGFANSRLTPSAAAFNPYRGGANDGFAYYNTAEPSVSACDNPIIIQQTLMSNITKHGATFQWVTFNPGSTTSYNIVLRSGGVSGTVVRIYSDLSLTDTNTLNITNLTPGVYYCLTVQEHCQPGTSTAVSNSACFTTQPDDCPPPTVLQHLGNTGSSVSLGWVPGETIAGVRNSSYEIQLTPQGSGSPYMYGGTITGTPVNRTITCLPASTFFTYQIREQCGVNKYSDWVNGYSTYTSTRCTAPDGLAATVVNTQNANLSWNSIYTNETSKPYQISYGVGITNAEQGTLTPVTTITPAQVSGTTRTHALNVATGVGNVTWFVREVCGMCDTTLWSGPHTLPPTTCNVPNVNNMSVSSVTTTSGIVSWLSTNYNSTATIELHDQTTGTYSYYNAGAGVGYNRTATISGLFANTVYDWRVKEYCTSGDSTAYSVAKQFTTPGGGGNSCAPPTNQGIFVTSGNVLIVQWNSNLYLDGSKSYEIAAGMNITSPAQATIQQSNGYYRTQSPTFPTHFFANGNTTGFTWFVRDVCSPGNYSDWLGPYVMGSSSKTDETGATEIAEAPVENVELQLYPNPNNGKGLTVKTNMTGTSTITIYNLQGQLVAQQLLNANGVTSLDVAGLADAVYTCHVTNGQLTKTIRLVIQR